MVSSSSSPSTHLPSPSPPPPPPIPFQATTAMTSTNSPVGRHPPRSLSAAVPGGGSGMEQPTRRGDPTMPRLDYDFFDRSGARRMHHALSEIRRGEHDDRAVSEESRDSESDELGASELSEEGEPGLRDLEALRTGRNSTTVDFERVVKWFIRRRDKSDIKPRHLGIIFRGLRVVGDGAHAGIQPSIATVLNPVATIRKLNAMRHPPLREILHDFEGCVRPGEMLLILGRPGSGCSTLLKVLANHRSEFRAIEGVVSYEFHRHAAAPLAENDGTPPSRSETTHGHSNAIIVESISPQTIAAHFRGDVQYCPEDDVHFPTLTVDQTLLFASKTRAPHVRLAGQPRSEYSRLTTNLYETIFGLNHVKGTVVGNASIRGISGGEKKRVSISETMATRSLLTSWDNSTRGLDASTALEYVRALRIATDLGPKTTIVSIYQAGEQLYNLFDKVCLIYEGRMVYFGPAHLARQYFIDMGYLPANRQTTADFLVSVTDPKGRRTTTSASNALRLQSSAKKEHASESVPQTPEGFEHYYRMSEVYRSNLEDIERYRNEGIPDHHRVQDGDGRVTGAVWQSGDGDLPDLEKQKQTKGFWAAYLESARQEKARHTRWKSPYTISIWMQVRIVMLRRVQIMKGNLTALIIPTSLFTFQAIIVGTTFIRVPDDTSAYFSRGGVIFFSMFVPAVFGMSEIPSLFSQRPIVHRHELAAMYHPMVEALAMTLVDVPFTFFTSVVFTVIVYFIVRLQQTAGQFFIFFLFIFTIGITFKAIFRGLAAMFSSEPPAHTVAGIFLLFLSVYAGYQIPRPSMIGALRWLSYINPTLYAFEALMVNEFHTLNGRCSALVPSGPGYDGSGITIANQVCPVVGAEPGQATVNGSRYLALSFQYYYRHLWRNYGVLCAFAAGFLCILFVFSEFKTRVAGDRGVLLFKSGAVTSGNVAEDEEKGGVDSSGVERPPRTNSDSETSGSGSGTQATIVNDSGTGAEAEIKQSALRLFSWDHIRYTVPVGGGQQRVLLDNVSGFVAPGKLTALMGESGAGKTTLMNVLAERTDTGVATGDRFFNGQALPPDFQSQTGYCQQTDTHVGNTTVREALQFSARLRQPASVSVLEKDEYAEKCLVQCGLQALADAMVGSLSVEQKKRTTIAVELAAKPKLLLFLDEPTSGLDSQSAWAIMSLLRALADNGQSILCTIHQPSAELFQVFDRLLLLMKGGKVVFFGDIGTNATSLISYFESNGARQCERAENPAEYMLDVIGAGATATTDRNWDEIWRASGACARATEELKSIHTEGRKHPPVEATLKTTFAVPWLEQTAVVTQRFFKSYWRDPTYLMSKLALNIVGGLFIGFTFFKTKNTIQDSQNKLFAIFMATLLCPGLGNQLLVPHMKMRGIFEVRERASRTYHWTAFITAQVMVELPWNILGSTLLIFCWYWTVGYPNDRWAFTYLMYGFLFPAYYTTIALAAASVCPTAEIAGLVYSFLFTFVLTFDGVVQPYQQLGWWRWMYHLSPFTYLIEALVGQAVGRQLIECSDTELTVIQPPAGQTCGAFMAEFIARAGGYITDPESAVDCQFCPSRTTDEWLLRSFNISYSRRWRDCGLFCAYILFNLAMVYILTYLVRIRRHTHVRWLRTRLFNRAARERSGHSD